MKTLTSLLFIGMLQLSVADTIPLTTGSIYYFTILGENPDASLLPNRFTPAKIIRQFDYPWVEVEWESSSVVLVDGKPTKTNTKVVRRYLNLDHVAAIKPGKGDATQSDEDGAGQAATEEESEPE